MKPPVVSVIIPAYNQAAFLKEALESLLNQRVTDWEAIVVNNFSEDETAAVVDAFEDPRIRRVDFRNHGVIAASRNEGARLARAEVLAFLDSDDRWYPEKLEACLHELTGDVGVVCHDFDLIGEQRATMRIRTGPYAPDFYRQLLFKSNCVATSGVVMRRDVFQAAGGFSEERRFITAEDYDLWLRIAKQDVVFRFINRPLGAYRVHSSSNSNAIPFHHEAILRVVEQHLAELEDPDPWQARSLYAKLFYSTGRAYHYRGQRAQARECFRTAIRYNPLWAKGYAGLVLSLLPSR
ncbi:MAG TPA: glycosyltransferase [Stenomitos sp.]